MTLLSSITLGLALAQDAAPADPYAWLEAVEAPEALAWVEARNQTAITELTQDPRYAPMEAKLRAIYDSKDKIPYAGKIGAWLYNVWQDAEHPRGLWRRTSPSSYRQASPEWETVLDLDALSEAEGKAWVWHGASCLPPEYTRCLLSLSPGGSDADVTREFDLTTKQFVEGGFALPESKGSLAWIDRDTVYALLAQGGDSETSSGYPRQVRVWRRGAPLAQAEVVFEGQASDVSVGAYHDFTPGFERDVVYRSPTFFTTEVLLRDGATHTRLEVPADANASLWREHLLVELRTAWEVGGQTFPAGSLITAPLSDFMRGERRFTSLFSPNGRNALAGITPTRTRVALTVLEDVRGRVEVWAPGADGWTRTSPRGLPRNAALGLSAVDPDESDRVWLTTTDFLTPTTLSELDLAKPAPPRALKRLPAYFDASGLEITQHFATSKDGTKVPYFQVGRPSPSPKGAAPTLLYGYGGFEVSLTPSYSAAFGAAWLEQGGVYVLANIRGGGEYGPSWHQAALKDKRHRAYEDFAAVADDLVARGVTDPKHLGAMGGSNGGLLMGNMLTLYPERFGAIVCQVPLLDMKRYPHLLAGASWMGEYGDPDVPEAWASIQTFSPYHNARADRAYPRTFFTTSTRDDRVHPGHARKMVAKLSEQGHDVLYWENTEGGHGGAATNADRAKMWAMSLVFLWRELGGG
jgi:prolyl oligopeptidase